MTQRPKLRLSPAGGKEKKQPQAFVVADPPHHFNDAPKTEEVSPTAQYKAAPKQPQKALGAHQPTRLNAKRITKTLLVVGAIAVSIFLLKRRFF